MSRTASEVIDQAIRENRRWETFVFILASIFVIVGIGLIIWSIMHDRPIMAVAGAVESTLFWPALHVAMQTRKANIILRLLEIPLGRSQTAIEAAEMLHEVLQQNF